MFEFYSCNLFLLVCLYDWKKNYYVFNIFKFIKICFTAKLDYDLSWRMFQIQLKGMCILLLFEGMF